MNQPDTTVLALVAIVGSVITALFALLNKNTSALNRVAKSSEHVAIETRALRRETKKGNQEAKERNGHLAELVIQTSENTVDALKITKRAVKEVVRDKDESSHK